MKWLCRLLPALSGFAVGPGSNEPISQPVRRDLTRYIRAKRMHDRARVVLRILRAQ